MDNQYDFQAFYLKLQELIFKKEKESIIIDFLNSKSFNINNIIEVLTNIVDETDNRIEIGVRILELIINNIESIKQNFFTSVKENHKQLEKVKHKHIKRFLINFFIQNIAVFAKEDYFYDLISIYISDDGIKIFESSMDLLVATYKNNEYASYINKNNILLKIFQSLADAKEKQKHLSIVLIREVELIIKLLNARPTEISEQKSFLLDLIKDRCLSFDKLDILTQLAFLEVVEKNVDNEDLLKLVLSEFNFFAKVIILIYYCLYNCLLF